MANEPTVTTAMPIQSAVPAGGGASAAPAVKSAETERLEVAERELARQKEENTQLRRDMSGIETRLAAKVADRLAKDNPPPAEEPKGRLALVEAENKRLAEETAALRKDRDEERRQKAEALRLSKIQAALQSVAWVRGSEGIVVGEFSKEVKEDPTTGELFTEVQGRFGKERVSLQQGAVNFANTHQYLVQADVTGGTGATGSGIGLSQLPPNLTFEQVVNDPKLYERLQREQPATLEQLRARYNAASKIPMPTGIVLDLTGQKSTF